MKPLCPCCVQFNSLIEEMIKFHNETNCCIRTRYSLYRIFKLFGLGTQQDQHHDFLCPVFGEKSDFEISLVKQGSIESCCPIHGLPIDSEETQAESLEESESTLSTTTCRRSTVKTFSTYAETSVDSLMIAQMKRGSNPSDSIPSSDDNDRNFGSEMGPLTVRFRHGLTMVPPMDLDKNIPMTYDWSTTKSESSDRKTFLVGSAHGDTLERPKVGFTMVPELDLSNVSPSFTPSSRSGTSDGKTFIFGSAHGEVLQCPKDRNPTILPRDTSFGKTDTLTFVETCRELRSASKQMQLCTTAVIDKKFKEVERLEKCRRRRRIASSSLTGTIKTSTFRPSTLLRPKQVIRHHKAHEVRKSVNLVNIKSVIFPNYEETTASLNEFFYSSVDLQYPLMSQEEAMLLFFQDEKYQEPHEEKLQKHHRMFYRDILCDSYWNYLNDSVVLYHFGKGDSSRSKDERARMIHVKNFNRACQDIKKMLVMNQVFAEKEARCRTLRMIHRTFDQVEVNNRTKVTLVDIFRAEEVDEIPINKEDYDFY